MHPQDTNYFAQDQDVYALSVKDFLQKYETLRVTDTTIETEPRAIIKFGEAILSTPENITTIAADPKAGKTSLLGVTLSGAIASGEYDGFPGWDVLTNSHGLAVVHIETEQSRSRHQQNIRSIIRRAGLQTCPENFLSYNIRRLSLADYAVVTQEICQGAADKFGGIHLIALDGGADYIDDVNDAMLSNGLVKAFEQLAIQFKAPVIVIMHLNPGGSGKERGHLGSQLQRKSESVINIKREGEISTIEAKLLRNGGNSDAPAIQFVYDKSKGYHAYLGEAAKADPGEKDRKRVELIRKITDEAFAPPNSFAYSDAIERIMKVSGKGLNTSKAMFKEMKIHGMINQGPDQNWRLLV